MDETTNTRSRGSGSIESEGARAPAPVAHPTPKERAAKGKAARAKVPRESHAGWDPPSDRRDPVDLLEEQATSRVPELVPIRYGRMLDLAVRLLSGRGLPHGRRPRLDAAVRAHRPGLRRRAPLELRRVRLPRAASWCSTSTTSTRRFPGPWEWDVKRLAASLAVAGRDNGFSDAERRDVVTASVGDYRDGDAGVRRDAQPRRLVLAPAGAGGSPAHRGPCSTRSPSRTPRRS